jgi:hypothetical protein
MRYVRIVAKATADNPEAPPLYVDAVVDEQGRLAGRHALFGFQGKFDRKDEHFYPFIFDRAGTIDFGLGYNDTPDLRYAKLDLGDNPVEPGRLLTLDSHWGRQLYRIDELAELPT